MYVYIYIFLKLVWGIIISIWIGFDLGKLKTWAPYRFGVVCLFVCSNMVYVNPTEAEKGRTCGFIQWIGLVSPCHLLNESSIFYCILIY